MEVPEHLRSALVHLREVDAAGATRLIEYFCQVRTQEMQRASAQCMAVVPRQYERASDYAAKAEVYEGFLADLLGSK